MAAFPRELIILSNLNETGEKFTNVFANKDAPCEVQWKMACWSWIEIYGTKLTRNELLIAHVQNTHKSVNCSFQIAPEKV